MSDDLKLGSHCHCPLHPPRHSDMWVGCDNERLWDGSTTGCDPAAWSGASDIEAALSELLDDAERYQEEYAPKGPRWAHENATIIERHIAAQAAEIEALRAGLVSERAGIDALVAQANRAERLEAALWEDCGNGLVLCRVCRAIHPNCDVADRFYTIGECVTHRSPCPLAETEAQPQAEKKPDDGAD